MGALLDVRNLRIELSTRAGVAPVIDNVSFQLYAGETLSFVGESGCGKSMTALGIMGLLPDNVGRIASGSILFNGEDLTRCTTERLREIRGNDISMIFQEPMTSLNPVFSIGEQIAEVLRRHQKLGKKAAWVKSVELLDAVRIPDAKRRAYNYPHQLSGGQRQRVMIAMALACEPQILIADEPTTALDVTIQAQIFDLLDDLRAQTGSAIIMITHDMGVVAEIAERMIVMYAGRTVERGAVEQVLNHPRHPYTKGLIGCVPHLQATLTEERQALTEIDGIVPALDEFGQDACLFASRCYMAESHCRKARPLLQRFADHKDDSRPHASACWLAEQL